MADEKPLRDIPNRGSRESSPLGTTIFAGLRALDPLFQHSILLSAPLTTFLPRLGLSAPFPPSNAPVLAFTGLGPVQSLLWAMSIGSAAKQIFNAVYIAKEPYYPFFSLMIAAFNTVMNSTNTLLFTASLSLPFQFPPYQVYLGAAMYVVGIFLETVSEFQRKQFKDSKAGQGKPFTGGLFGLARHINYGGYTLWRAGFALAAAGPVWGSIIALFFGYDFATRGVPVLDAYCSKRYGEAWQKYRREVRWRLIPGVY